MMEGYLDIRAVQFALTAVLSFLIGLEIKSYRARFHGGEAMHGFGSARTYTFIGVLGYLFWVLGVEVYIAAMAGITFLYALYYREQLRSGKSSVLLYVAALAVYGLGPLTTQFALWMPASVFVLVIFIFNAKRRLQELVLHFNADELEILGKMVLLSAVILPLLPRNSLGRFLPLSPFEIWTAVVIVSAISYGGYLVQKYFFRRKGYVIAGLVGGVYSSTATTVVLSRKAAEIGNRDLMTSAIVAASAMMYLRLVAVAAIFNAPAAGTLLLPFVGFAAAGVAVAAFYGARVPAAGAEMVPVDTNPLELGTAFLFAGLFMAMMAATQAVTAHFGTEGLRLLSFIVGFTDIDPFVLSLLTGHASVGRKVIVSSIMIAAGSNNLLKALYALWFGRAAGRTAALWLLLLGFGTIGAAFFY